MKTTYLNKKILLVTFCLAWNCIMFAQESRAEQLNTVTFSSFEDWCENKDTLNEETKHTVEMLLLKAKTSDCKFASKKLSTYKSLRLDKRGISNLLPLSSLKNLNQLNINDNKIADIKPLESLTKLTELSISDNLISDLSPLKNMKGLNFLAAKRNQISDVTPLQNLTKLERLFLDRNKITDVMPLRALINLETASFRENPIINKTCPVTANTAIRLATCIF
jgi:internalin A